MEHASRKKMAEEIAKKRMWKGKRKFSEQQSDRVEWDKVVQGGKKSLFVDIVDEFYTVAKLNFKVKIILFFLHYILLITKVKLF